MTKATDTIACILLAALTGIVAVLWVCGGRRVVDWWHGRNNT